MIALDEGALECDLAETYNIYDYRALNPNRVALFSVGLRDSSRIKIKISGNSQPLETLLLASVVDRLSLILWSKSKDAERNANRPNSIVEILTKKESAENDVESFETPEEFERAWAN